MHKLSLFKASLLGITLTLFANAAAPTIEWTTDSGSGADPFSGPINPASATSGQTYMIRARGMDSDGNLVAVSIDRNGVPFAYAGGGDGWTYISNNPSSGAATYTAWATDSNNQDSDRISWTVNHSATPPQANTPAISISGDGTASVQVDVTATYAAGSEPITNFHIERSYDNANWEVVSFAGTSHNYADTALGTRTVYYKCAVSDDHANTWSFSGLTYATYTVTAAPEPPQPVSASIAISTNRGTWPLSPTVSWASAYATSVSVSGPGLSSSSPTDSQKVENLAPGFHTYTITAQGMGGPLQHSVSVTVDVPFTTSLIYPRRKYVGAYYDAWFSAGYPWTGVWGVGLTPAIGRYVSDVATGQAHAQKLAGLGVDFVAIDNTNNTLWGPAHPQEHLRTDWIFENSKAVISGFAGTPLKAVIMLSVANSRGGEGLDASTEQLLTENYASGTPVMYFNNIPTNAGDLFRAKVARVYQELATDPSRYFHYEGKPLLLLYTTASGLIHDKNGQNVTPNGKLEGAHLDIPIPGLGNQQLTSLFTIRWVGAFVSRSGNSAYVGAPDDTIARNGHWSWEDTWPQSWAKQPTGWGTDVFPETMTVTAASRAYAANSAAGRLGGATFLKQWERVWEVDPVLTMVHTWNEFSYHSDEATPELSQSIEANDIFGNTYETHLHNYAGYLRSLRLDVGLYDVNQRRFRLFNRKDDFPSRATTFFGFESQVDMNRGDAVEAIGGDFNHDGLYEVGLRNRNDGSVALRFSPRFTVSSSGDSHAEVVVVNLPAGSQWRMFTGDFDTDGYCDLGFYDTSAGMFRFYLNNHNYGFDFSHQLTWNVGANVQVACADINADGDWDLVVREPNSGVITLALNNGDDLAGVPARQYTLNWLAGTGQQLFVGDFNHDGAAEVGLREAAIGRFHFRKNNRSVNGLTWDFAPATAFDATPGAALLPVVGDFR